MTVALVAIVRNEEATLPRMLASVRDHIDSYTIVDTGSEDDTVAVIERELAGTPGVVHRRDWVDFGHNRAEAIALATGTADYLLLADADFEFVIGDDALADLEDDVYMVDVYEGSMRYAYAAILRSGPNWTYTGRTHEALNIGNRRVGHAGGIEIGHRCNGGMRYNKFRRDLGLLSGLGDPRSTFYRAQTLKCLGRYEDAAATYLERAAMGGWDEEVYVSRLNAGMLLNDVELLLAAHSGRPSRIEALYEALHRLRHAGAHEAAYALSAGVDCSRVPDDLLFVETWVWSHGFLFEHALACQNTGRLEEAEEAYRWLLDGMRLPQSYRIACDANLGMLVKGDG